MTKKAVWFPTYRRLRCLIPADFEAWLEQLALEGWNLEQTGVFSPLRMVFYKTEPKQYRYVYDPNYAAMIKKQDYKQTYEQFGWEYVGCVNANNFLWRKEYTDVRPESFTDRESLIWRNKRILNPTIAGLILTIVATLFSLVAIGVCVTVGKQESIPFLVFCAVLMGLLSIFTALIVRKLRYNLDC
jgi:hypothetical protein